MLNIDIRSKKYSEKNILQNIQFSLKEGTFLSIIGPSGCGKTTLLKLISSLDIDFEGSINMDAKSIGMMFQEPRLLPWLTVRENIAVVKKIAAPEAIKELLRMVGLEHTLDMYPKNLSGGMARRVSLVRAFINRPKLILLDEPFVSLDKPTSLALQNDLMLFCKSFNPAVILVTHDLDEAIALSQKILFLGGEVTEEVMTHVNDHNGFETLEPSQVQMIKENLLSLYPNILEGKL
ncbi:MAG: ABC transporter ATP-binding protein [Sulfuricurvum sp.]|uniref:ABC transporter ATP-binding protein n=1 Tax=Sulfuricurvum sp. TaxID=2025608 RepID=UPI002619F35B|nr:ABC transporter ATP-binding protein [Sulfuricurvum sp.]MDD2368024.1 ABC transporter ATP-binding protein [Sulfuricurvum sp.]MDD5119508.1 ABC transporter ATP-binding protein [Sulfuricurvum sp.]